MGIGQDITSGFTSAGKFTMAAGKTLKKQTLSAGDHLKKFDPRENNSSDSDEDAKGMKNMPRGTIAAKMFGKGGEIANKVADSPNTFRRLGSWDSIGSSLSSSTRSIDTRKPMITSIAVLDDVYFLTASKHDKSITLHKTVEGGTEVVREFEGHSSGVTALAVLDKKGRFLSAGKVCQITWCDLR